MLRQTINLLPKNLLKKSRQRKEMGLLAIKLSYFLLVFLLILTLFIFLPTYVLTKQVKSVQQKVEEKQKIIENEEVWENLIRVAERQILALKELKKDRFFMNTRLQYLDSFLGADINLVSFHADKDVLSLAANTPSLLSFANFITNLQKAKKIEGIELTASNLDKDKSAYSFSLNLFFNEKEL